MKISKDMNIDEVSIPENMQIYKYTKSHIIINFNEILNNVTDNLKYFKLFGSHRNAKEKICHYANWFHNFYDPDRDVLISIVRMKYKIDKQRLIYTESAFFSDLEDIFTDKIIKLIYEMTDDQYIIDLEANLKKVKSKNEYNSKFTNRHGRIALAAMIATNVTSPVVNHYLENNKDIQKKIFMSKYVSKILLIFEKYEAKESELEQVSIVNKITLIIEMKINESKTHAKMWERQNNQSNSPAIMEMQLMKVALADLIHKAKFSGNIVIFIIVAITDNIDRQLIGRSAYDSFIIDIDQTQGELSQLEIIDMNHITMDENQSVISEIEIKEINKLFQDRMIMITKKNFNKLMRNIKPNPYQILLVSLFISSKLHNFNNRLSQENYIKAALVMSHDLKLAKYVLLPEIILANPKTSVKRRVSSKIVTKIYESPLYNVLERQYSDFFGTELKDGDKKNNPLIKIFLELNSWIFEPILENDYNKELNDNISSSVLSHELLRFILSI